MDLAPSLGKKHSGKTERDRLIEGEKMLSAYSNGVKISQIMVDFDVSHGTVHNRLKRAISERIAVTVDQYRASANSVYDEQMQRAQQHIVGAEELIRAGAEAENPVMVERGLNHHLKAMEMINKIVEGRRRLNGTDAPVKIEATVTTVDVTDKALMDLSAEVEARVAAE